MALPAKANLTSGVTATVYTVPAGKIATVNISACNSSGTAADLTLAIGTGASPAAGDYIKFASAIGGEFERTGLVLAAGEKVFALSTASNVSIRVHGFEE